MKILGKIKNILGKGKINKFTLYVGLNDKDKRKQLFSIENAKDIISKIFAENKIERSNISKRRTDYILISQRETQKKKIVLKLKYYSQQIIKLATQ